MLLPLIAALAAPALAESLDEPTDACVAPAIEAPLRKITPDDLPALVAEAKGCVVLVELYAGWCGTCWKTAPAVEALHTTYGPRGLVIQAVSVDTDDDMHQKWLDQRPAVSPPMRVTGWSLEGLETVFAGMGGSFEKAIPFFLLFDRESAYVMDETEPKSLDALEEKIKGLL